MEEGENPRRRFHRLTQIKKENSYLRRKEKTPDTDFHRLTQDKENEYSYLEDEICEICEICVFLMWAVHA